MELYLLHTFEAVAKAGGIRKAAARLHMTSPTASGHIKALEEELQITLFDRTPKGMVLTADGRVLLSRAEEIIRSARKLQDLASELRDCISGTLLIGLNAPPGLLKAAELAVEVKRSPNIAITFEPSSTGKILKGLSSGQLDAGFIFGALRQKDKDIETIPLESFALCIAVPAVFCHCVKPSDWKALARLPWIHSDGYCPFQEIAATLFERQGLAIENSVATNDETTKRELVRQGLGVALLLEDECREDALTGKMSIWKTDPIRVGLFFAYPSKRREDPVLHILRKAVRTVWTMHDS